MAIHWDEERQAFEFTSMDGSYVPDEAKWTEWVREMGGEFESFTGPAVHEGEAERTWYRVTGKPARQMHETATKGQRLPDDWGQRDTLSAQAEFLMPPGVQSMGPPPGEPTAPEPIQQFIKNTVFRWRDGGYEFSMQDGTPLSQGAVDKSNDDLHAIGSTFKALPQSLWLKPNYASYRIEGPAAQIAYMEAMRCGNAYGTGFVAQTLTGVKPVPVELDELQRPVPEWEGTHCWRSVHLALTEISNLYREEMDEHHHKVTGVVAGATDAELRMVDAHPIVIGTEQVMALPPPSFTEACEYLRDAELPFNPMFLDCADGPGAAAMCFLPDQRNNMLGFCGGLIHRSPDQTMVFPFGAVMQPNDVREWLIDKLADDSLERDGLRRFLEDNPSIATMYGDMSINQIEHQMRSMEGGMLMADPGGHGLPSHAGLGSVLFGTELYAHYEEPVIRHSQNAEPLPLSRIEELPPVTATEILIVPGPVLTGPKDVAVVVGIPHVRCYLQSERTKTDPQANLVDAIGWGTMVAQQTCRIAGVLMLLNAANVELAEAQVSRQVRRQIERKGGRISKVVKVRHRRSAPRDVEKANGHREYSHQFEVIGHFRHFTKGPHVRCPNCHDQDRPGYFEGPTLPGGKRNWIECEQCRGAGLDPSKVATCTRRYSDGPNAGELTCPNGCRKEWVPPYIKGPTDKPLVLKSRQV